VARGASVSFLTRLPLVTMSFASRIRQTARKTAERRGGEDAPGDQDFVQDIGGNDGFGSGGQGENER
jgi:hypothetical protein